MKEVSGGGQLPHGNAAMFIYSRHNSKKMDLCRFFQGIFDSLELCLLWYYSELLLSRLHGRSLNSPLQGQQHVKAPPPPLDLKVLDPPFA